MATLTPDNPILTGGLLTVDPAVERYPVRPGGATVIEIAGDDRVRIIDRFGGQVAELTVLADTVTRSLGARLAHDAPATVIQRLAAAGHSGFVAELHARGLKPEEARCARLFGPDSPAGAEVTLTANGR